MFIRLCHRKLIALCISLSGTHFDLREMLQASVQSLEKKAICRADNL